MFIRQEEIISEIIHSPDKILDIFISMLMSVGYSAIDIERTLVLYISVVCVLVADLYRKAKAESRNILAILSNKNENLSLIGI